MRFDYQNVILCEKINPLYDVDIKKLYICIDDKSMINTLN